MVRFWRVVVFKAIAPGVLMENVMLLSCPLTPEMGGDARKRNKTLNTPTIAELEQRGPMCSTHGLNEKTTMGS
jgi:hypothetical protein